MVLKRLVSYGLAAVLLAGCQGTFDKKPEARAVYKQTVPKAESSAAFGSLNLPYTLEDISDEYELSAIGYSGKVIFSCKVDTYLEPYLNVKSKKPTKYCLLSLKGEFRRSGLGDFVNAVGGFFSSKVDLPEVWCEDKTELSERLEPLRRESNINIVKRKSDVRTISDWRFYPEKEGVSELQTQTRIVTNGKTPELEKGKSHYGGDMIDPLAFLYCFRSFESAQRLFKIVSDKGNIVVPYYFTKDIGSVRLESLGQKKVAVYFGSYRHRADCAEEIANLFMQSKKNSVAILRALLSDPWNTKTSIENVVNKSLLTYMRGLFSTAELRIVTQRLLLDGIVEIALRQSNLGDKLLGKNDCLSFDHSPEETEEFVDDSGLIAYYFGPGQKDSFDSILDKLRLRWKSIDDLLQKDTQADTKTVWDDVGGYDGLVKWAQNIVTEDEKLLKFAGLPSGLIKRRIATRNDKFDASLHKLVESFAPYKTWGDKKKRKPAFIIESGENNLILSQFSDDEKIDFYGVPRNLINKATLYYDNGIIQRIDVDLDGLPDVTIERK